jgi:hypothetical protein
MDRITPRDAELCCQRQHLAQQQQIERNHMNTLLILESAAQFNATHDYDIEAALRLSSLVVRHAHRQEAWHAQ